MYCTLFYGWQLCGIAQCVNYNREYGCVAGRGVAGRGEDGRDGVVGRGVTLIDISLFLVCCSSCGIM